VAGLINMVDDVAGTHSPSLAFFSVMAEDSYILASPLVSSGLMVGPVFRACQILLATSSTRVLNPLYRIKRHPMAWRAISAERIARLVTDFAPSFLETNSIL